MKKHCLALDLKDDPELIGDSGIQNMEIYRISNRLFMIIEVEDSFSFEQKAKLDKGNVKVQEWEVLMWEYQQALPIAKPGEKWLPMDKIFEFPVG